MTTGILVTILILSLLGIAAIVFYLWRHQWHLGGHVAASTDVRTEAQREVDVNVDHIFNDAFREELRNHGRLYFDKIVGENAMFLQQDLRLTSSQINEYMKKEISTKLAETFANYEQSMKDAQAVALDTIQKTMRAAEEQRDILNKQTQELLEAEKQRAVQHFEDNMADIVNHYLAEAFGNQLSLEDQLGYIVGEMEANKEAMKQDMQA
jgi:DNA-binding transcriptional MerR regulator